MAYSDDDTKFGTDNEIQFYKILKENFDTTLERSDYKYSLFDYSGEKCFVELKSRRIDSTQYKDTMIGCNKLLFARNCAKDFYFVFSFTDGLFYYKFSKEDYDTGVIRSAYGGRNDRGKDEQKPYCYIPIKLFKKINYLKI
jgi:hypothetical protein